MGETFGVILPVALIAAFLTTAFFFVSWWMESERRLHRAMKNALSGDVAMQAVAPTEGKATALDLGNEQLAVLWNRGAIGLVFDFKEVDGAELIVDGHVVARVRRFYGRKDLDVLVDDAENIILRLMFSSPQCPEFEISLWRAEWSPHIAVQQGATTSASGPRLTGSAGEGMRLGRRWLAQVEAITKS